MGFQTSVNVSSPIGTEGAKASSNPIAAVLSDVGGNQLASALIADLVNGLNIGRFAWVSSNGQVLTNYAPGGVPSVPDGFVMNTLLGNNSNLLNPNGINIPPGAPATAFNRGDFFARSNYANALRGNKVFANLFDGSVVPAASGSFPSYPSGSAGAFSGWISAAGVLTVTSVASGSLGVGMLLAGIGVPINARIASLGTGTGGVGTYNLSLPNALPTFTIQASLNGTQMTVTSANGILAVGQLVAGTGITSPVYISALGTGSGGAGTYTLSAAVTTESTETITVGGVYTESLTGTAAGSVGGATVTATMATNVMTVTAVTNGVLTPGQLLTDSTTGLAAGTYIVNQLTGTTGGVGTYTVSTTPGTLASGTVTASAWIETPWYFQTQANEGELAIIGTRF
jgi:hypothetical protein